VRHTDAMERPTKQAKAPLEHLRKICLAMPGASEKLSHGEPTWFVKKVFVMFSDHHHDDRVAFWCPAPPGAQEAHVRSDPKRFFVPPYVGGKGWLGVYLDVKQDWKEIAEIVEEAWRLTAPKVIVLEFDEKRHAARAPKGMTKAAMYKKLGKVCLALPGTENKPFGGHHTPCYRVRDKIFCGTGQAGRPRMNVKAPPGVQQALVGSDPVRFFVPDYTGPKGWVGVWLDVEQDWDELAELVEESYRMTAPKALIAELDARTR
jgi:hypothetical protein